MTAKECIDQIMSSNAFMRGCRDIDRFNDYINSLLELLEKQIPKEPIPQDENCLECPNCDSFIGYASECKDEHYRVEYCPNCGQAIKWE